MQKKTLLTDTLHAVLLVAERPLEGFHIVVDAGNGAGGFFAVCYGCLTPISPPPKTHLQCINTAQSDLFTAYIACFLLLLQLFMFA
jgi:hypothetical protein